MTEVLLIVAKTTALLAAAFAADWLARRQSASARSLIWALAFVALGVLIPLSLWGPEWRPMVSMPATVFSLSVDAGGASQPEGLGWAFWLWFAGFAVVMARLAAAHLRIARLVSKTRRAGGRVRHSPAGSMPLTWGLFHPVILLPADASEWEPEIRASVLRHEQAHIRRGDLWMQLIEQTICAVYWFHPLVWLAAGRASDVRERACDDEALASGGSPEDYAAHLIAVARLVRPLCSVAATTFCHRLEGRIVSILNRNQNRRAARRPVKFLTACAALALLVGLAGVQTMAQNEDRPAGEKSVYKVGEDGVSAPTLIEKVQPKYTERARNAGVEGVVILTLDVSPAGTAEDIRVTQALDPGLDVQAMDAVSQWKFNPGMRNGEPVRVAAEIEINFSLED